MQHCCSIVNLSIISSDHDDAPKSNSMLLFSGTRTPFLHTLVDSRADNFIDGIPTKAISSPKVVNKIIFPFSWTSETNAVFTKLKELFRSDPVLTHPDPS